MEISKWNTNINAERNGQRNNKNAKCAGEKHVISLQCGAHIQMHQQKTHTSEDAIHEWRNSMEWDGFHTRKGREKPLYVCIFRKVLDLSINLMEKDWKIHKTFMTHRKESQQELIRNNSVRLSLIMVSLFRSETFNMLPHSVSHYKLSVWLKNNSPFGWNYSHLR